MGQIIYGVGSSVLRDFVDKTKIVALSKLKNVSVDTSASDEKLYGGDSPYPFATFPKDKAIKVSAENATFSMDLMNVTQGATISTGAVTMTNMLTVNIPADGIINLTEEPLVDTLVVSGYTEAGTVETVTTGQYFQDGVDPKKLTFDTDDAGKEVDIVFDYTSGTGAKTLAVMKETLSKPFTFIHRIPIYNDNNVIEGYGQLTVYKCVANNSFNFNLQPQTAFAPKLDLEALDPKRPDGKLWDFVIDPVVTP